MAFIVRAIDAVTDWSARIAAVLLALMTALILVEILLWNLFETTTRLADEYSAYGLAAVIFLGSGYCLKRRGHIRITLILSFLPPLAVRVVTFLATTLTTAFMGYLWYYLYQMTAGAYRYGSTSGTLTATPLWIPMALMLAGAAVFFLQFTACVIKTLAAVKTGEEVF